MLICKAKWQKSTPSTPTLVCTDCLSELLMKILKGLKMASSGNAFISSQSHCCIICKKADCCIYCDSPLALHFGSVIPHHCWPSVFNWLSSVYPKYRRDSDKKVIMACSFGSKTCITSGINHIHFSGNYNSLIRRNIFLESPCSLQEPVFGVCLGFGEKRILPVPCSEKP